MRARIAAAIRIALPLIVLSAVALAGEAGQRWRP
jgi:hypothetical protein